MLKMICSKCGERTDLAEQCPYCLGKCKRRKSIGEEFLDILARRNLPKQQLQILSIRNEKLCKAKDLISH